MKENQYLSNGTTAEAKAYVDGFIDGVEVAGGGTCPYKDAARREAYVKGRIAEYEATMLRYVRAGAKKTIAQRQFDEAEVRGMLFGVSQLTEELAAHDKSGGVTSKLDKAAPYPKYVMRNIQTGAEITPERYVTLGVAAQADFKPVRYFQAGCSRIYEDDLKYLAEFIVQDFLRHPGLKKFYEQEMAPGGRLERYKEAVEITKRDYGWNISALEHRLAQQNE